MDGFVITPTADGAEIRFDLLEGMERVARFRAAFPRAAWQPRAGTWALKGKRAVARLEKWASQQPAPSDADFQRARDALEFEPIRSEYVEIRGDWLVLRTPYDADLVETVRAIPGRRFVRDQDGPAGAWHIPALQADALRRALPRIEQIARAAEDRLAAKRAQMARDAAARLARRYRMPSAPEDMEPPSGRLPDRPASRFYPWRGSGQPRQAPGMLLDAEACPMPGTVIETGGRRLVVHHVGQPFRIEGRAVRYAFLWEAPAGD